MTLRRCQTTHTHTGGSLPSVTFSRAIKTTRLSPNDPHDNTPTRNTWIISEVYLKKTHTQTNTQTRRWTASDASWLHSSGLLPLASGMTVRFCSSHRAATLDSTVHTQWAMQSWNCMTGEWTLPACAPTRSALGFVWRNQGKWTAGSGFTLFPVQHLLTQEDHNMWGRNGLVLA